MLIFFRKSYDVVNPKQNLSAILHVKKPTDNVIKLPHIAYLSLQSWAHLKDVN